jgi:CspA family cold shock protein
MKHLNGSAEGAWTPCELKFYRRDRGFGFLTPTDGGPDIFIYDALLREAGVLQIPFNTPILAKFEKRTKGLVATDIKLKNSANAYL